MSILSWAIRPDRDQRFRFKGASNYQDSQSTVGKSGKQKDMEEKEIETDDDEQKYSWPLEDLDWFQIENMPAPQVWYQSPREISIQETRSIWSKKSLEVPTLVKEPSQRLDEQLFHGCVKEPTTEEKVEKVRLSERPDAFVFGCIKRILQKVGRKRLDIKDYNRLNIELTRKGQKINKTRLLTILKLSSRFRDLLTEELEAEYELYRSNGRYLKPRITLSQILWVVKTLPNSKVPWWNASPGDPAHSGEANSK